jgi:hypothetical protein
MSRVAVTVTGTDLSAAAPAAGNLQVVFRLRLEEITNTPQAGATVDEFHGKNGAPGQGAFKADGDLISNS